MVGFSDNPDTVTAGLTVRGAVLVMLPCVAVMVTFVVTETGEVVIGKVALLAPAITVTFAGTLAAGSELAKLITTPPVPAAPVSVTVPVDEVPPVTDVGEVATEESEAAGGETASVALFGPPANEAVMVTLVVEETG